MKINNIIKTVMLAALFQSAQAQEPVPVSCLLGHAHTQSEHMSDSFLKDHLLSIQDALSMPVWCSIPEWKEQTNCSSSFEIRVAWVQLWSNRGVW